VNIKLNKRAAIAATAITALGLVAVPATGAMAADAEKVAPNGHFSAYLIDTEDEQTLAGETLAWDRTVAIVASLDDVYGRFPVSPNATGVKLFLAEPGDELNQNEWYGWSEGALVDVNGSGPSNGYTYTPLNYLSDGNRAGDISDVKVNGGHFHLGFVYTNENGNQIISGTPGTWIDVTVTAGSGDWVFKDNAVEQPEPPVVPASGNPSNVTVNEGTTATFTATATGRPTPTVKWESKSGSGQWTTVVDQTSTTLSVAASNADNGTQYRAVFTNSAGSATTTAATLSVVDVPDPIVEPNDTDNASTKVVIAPLAEGQESVTIPAGQGNANKDNLAAWAFSTPTALGLVDTDASGNAVVDLSGVPAGEHKVALAESDNTILAWGTVVVPTTVGEPIPDEVDVSATITATDLWALEGVPASVDFGDVKRNATATQTITGVKVVDDRAVLKGWSLDAAWSPFAAGTDTIPASALTIAGKAAAGSTLLEGVTIGTGAKLAESTPVSTLEAGALFDADLTFKAPKDAKVGEYHSTLTLTLTSK
jgi:hypothetical protein